jgi:hypothetical protein
MTGGLLRFDRADDPQASVVNQGTISIRNAGLAAFVAPHVVNDGIITATYGRVALGAGTAFTLDLYGDELISFAVGDEITQTITKDDGTNAKALVENTGRISATEGRIQLTAAAARAVVNQSVNVSGIVEANSLSTTGGRIVLKGSGTVMTERSAQVTAGGHTGGEIRVEGNAVHLDGRVSVDGSSEAAPDLDAGHGGDCSFNDFLEAGLGDVDQRPWRERADGVVLAFVGQRTDVALGDGLDHADVMALMRRCRYGMDAIHGETGCGADLE